MYHDFNNEKDLDIYLDDFLKSLKPKSPKYKFTKELIKDKEKLCFTHTGNNFICSNGCASRCESHAHWVKSCSSIKKAMRQWNLYEWYCYYDVLVNSYISKTKKIIETTILKGNGWCGRYVEEWLNTSLKESTTFHVVKKKPMNIMIQDL